MEPLKTYDHQDAAQIGHLFTYLSERFDGSPVPEETLRDIIESPYHEQLVARRDDGSIVGTATLAILIGAGVGRKAWLDDFVVDATLQGGGVGGLLWNAMIEWCKNNNATILSFTSNPKRVAAHAFYLKRGAEIYETDYFKKKI